MKLSQFVEIRSPCQVCTVFLKNQSWDHSFGPDFWTVSFYRMLAWRWINSEEAGSDVCASRPPAFLSWWTVSSTWASPIMKRSEEITNYPLGCTNHDVYILDCIVIALASCQWCMRYSMMETSVRFLTPKQKWQDVAMERGVFTFSSIIASIYIYTSSIYRPQITWRVLISEKMPAPSENWSNWCQERALQDRPKRTMMKASHDEMINWFPTLVMG